MKAILVALAAGPIAFVAVSTTRDGSAARLAAAASQFVASLDDDLKAEATFPFDAEERQKWHFVPGRYPGVELGALSTEQRILVHALLRAGLSTSGYHKATTIMTLEDVLRAASEKRGRAAPHRDPNRYSIAIFGEPSTSKPWGWRIQGHHVSLNFSSIDEKLVEVAPAFLGANPHQLRTGPYAGLRALGAEEDLAFELLSLLTEEQRGDARIADEAPRDIFLDPAQRPDALGAPQGLAAAAMTDVQTTALRALIAEFAHNLRRDLAEHELERIDAAGFGKIHFAWAGAMERGKGHYYRVHGPTFVIEYDNTQNDANHSHTVWRDPNGDFGEDLLAEHYRRHHR